MHPCAMHAVQYIVALPDAKPYNDKNNWSLYRRAGWRKRECMPCACAQCCLLALFCRPKNGIYQRRPFDGVPHELHPGRGQPAAD